MTEDEKTSKGGLARSAASLAAWSARFRWLVMAIALALTAFSAWLAVTGLKINTDNLDMISRDAPFRQANLDFRAAFPWYGNQIAVVIDAAAPELAEQEAARLLTAMQARPDLFQHVQAPGIDPFLRRHGLLFMETDQLQNLLDRLAEAQGLLAELAERPDLTGLLGMLELALSEADPASPQTAQLAEVVETLNAMAAGEPDAPEILSWRRLLAIEGQRGLEARQIVVAKPVQNFTGLSPAKAAMAELRVIFRDAGAGVSHRITGNAALNTEELQSVKLGGSTAGVISGVGILVLLILGLRSVRSVLATLTVLVSGLVISLGFATLAVGQLNLLSVTFAVLFIGLAVDFSIHFALRVREAGGGVEAIREAAASVGPSIALSAVAAAIGFLSFLPTDYRGLAELGVIAGGSMAIALALNLTLLPALLAGQKGQGPGAGRESRFPILPHRPALLIMLLTIVGFALAVTMIRFDSDPINLKDAASESVATYRDLADDEARGVFALDALVPPSTDLMALEAQLGVATRDGRVLNLDRFVPDDQEAKLRALESAALFLFPVLTAAPREAPDNKDRQAAIAAFQAAVGDAEDTRLGRASMALAKSLAQMSMVETAAYEKRVTATLQLWLTDLRTAFEAQAVTADTMPEDFKALWMTPDGRQRLQVFPGADFDARWSMADYARDVTEVMPSATGAPVMVTFAGDAVVASFIEASIIAAALVLMLLAAILRKFRDVLLTVAPVALAATLTFVAMAALGLKLNFANVIVLPLLSGLGVASAVHVVMRRRVAGSAAVLMTSSTPRAVLFSTLTTLASFGGLALSPHLGMASMGLLLTIAILSILFMTLVWLPAVLRHDDTRAANK